MNILYTCDDNYTWLMIVSMISLFENNQNTEEINVYLLGYKISETNKLLISQVVKKYHRKCTVIDISEFHMSHKIELNRWPVSAFFRLYASKWLPSDVRKVLYLDCDTVVCADLSELYDTPFDGKAIFGVKDCLSHIYKTNIGMKKEDSYINAGVLLMNIDFLRQKNVTHLIDNFVNKYDKQIHYADQDILNGIFHTDIGSVRAAYNVMTIETSYSYKNLRRIRRPSGYYEEKEVIDAVKNPKIIHYTTNLNVVRPWFSNSNHPKSSEFQKYLALSPFKDRALKQLEQSSIKNRMIRILEYLPEELFCLGIGGVHAILVPIYIRLKGNIEKC